MIFPRHDKARLGEGGCHKVPSRVSQSRKKCHKIGKSVTKSSILPCKTACLLDDGKTMLRRIYGVRRPSKLRQRLLSFQATIPLPDGGENRDA
jgi:hypothetical protein